jgi:hypothetical protein
MTKSLVRWPPGMEPEIAPVYTRNELEMEAPPVAVWRWLVRATAWPDWYANSRNVVIDGGGTDLAPGARFHWTTFHVRVHTVVEEFVPEERLAWSGKGLGARGYHGWVIEPRTTGCRVVTEETQHGLVPSLGRLYLRRGLLREHQRWLEGLARMARSA